MFGVTNAELRNDIKELRQDVIVITSRMIELKILLVDVKSQTLGNRVAISKDKNPTKEIIKEIVVERARKKSRARLRKTDGGSKITEKEIDEMIKLFDQGLSYTEISGTMNRSASSVSNKIFERKEAEELTNL